MKGKSGWERYATEELRANLEKLPEGLYHHCVRASRVSRDLAGRFGCDSAKAEAAAMLHDIARALRDEELRDLAKQYGLTPVAVEEDLPLLLHAPLGAEILRRRYAVADEDILGAVACHQTGKRGMSAFDKVVFLADKIEPEKVHFRPELKAVEELAEKDLDRAVLKFLDLQLAALIEAALPIHPTMVEARNEILMRLPGQASTRYHRP